MRYFTLVLLLLLASCSTTIKCWDGSTVEKKVGCPPQQSLGHDQDLEKLLNRHNLTNSYEYKESPILALSTVPFPGPPTQHVKVYGDKAKVTRYDDHGVELETVYLDLAYHSVQCTSCSGNYEDYALILPTDLILSVPTNAKISGQPYPYHGTIAVRDQDKDIVVAPADAISRPTQMVEWDVDKMHYQMEIDISSGLPRRLLLFENQKFVRGVEYVFFGYDTVDEADVLP